MKKKGKSVLFFRQTNIKKGSSVIKEPLKVKQDHIFAKRRRKNRIATRCRRRGSSKYAPLSHTVRSGHHPLSLAVTVLPRYRSDRRYTSTHRRYIRACRRSQKFIQFMF